MRKFSKLFLAGAASFMMFSCSSSDEPGAGSSAEGDVYATLTLSLPSAGRSSTVDGGGDNTNSSGGFEVGQDKENTVGAVLVVIATKETDGSYKYVTSSVAASALTGTTNNRPTYNVRFESQSLAEKAGSDVVVFAYCNPTTQLINAVNTWGTTGFTDAAGDIDDGIHKDNAFLMTNAKIAAEVTLPADDALAQYNTAAKAFNLGTVEVSRVSARFDFKETTISGESVANRYPIKDINDNSITVAYIQLDGMTLLNQAKDFYYLPRVSADGTATDAVICGTETTTNYVVSPNYDRKKATPLELNWIGTAFNFNPAVTYGEANDKHGYDFSNLTYESMETVAAGGEDNDENWGTTVTDKTGYHIWKYTSENTIPQVDTQRQGITSGVVFRGHIEAVSGSALEGYINAKKNLYLHDGTLYGDFEALRTFVQGHPTHPVATDFNSELSAGETVADVQEVNFKNNKGKFAIYRPDTDGKYYVYYPYYNRHNDNGDNTVMGPMEFAVVRNNVYKLKVDNVLQFGHPAKPGDDNKPVNPVDPDETKETYFKVSVQVLPWVVRVNNIIL